MTFCLTMKLKDGLVGLADTRITSGNEFLTASKVTVRSGEGRHAMFLMTSGLRSVRDKALTYFDEVIGEEHSFVRLYQLANAFAEQVRRVAQEDGPALAASGLQFNLHTLVAGQLEGDVEPRLYMLYPQGNWVEVGQSSPYFIIGNTGYGKPLLNRSIRYESPLRFAIKAAFLAFDATYVSATDVGYPIDLIVQRRDSFAVHMRRFEESELRPVAEYWQQLVAAGVRDMRDDWADSLLKGVE